MGIGGDGVRKEGDSNQTGGKEKGKGGEKIKHDK